MIALIQYILKKEVKQLCVGMYMCVKDISVFCYVTHSGCDWHYTQERMQH